MISHALHLQYSTVVIYARILWQLEQSAHCRRLLLRSLKEGLAPLTSMLLCKHNADIRLIADCSSECFTAHMVYYCVLQCPGEQGGRVTLIRLTCSWD